MGEFWLWQPAEHVILREFCYPEGPIAVRFSHSNFGLVVQSLDDAAGELLLGPEVVEQQLPVRAYGSGEQLYWLNPRSHRARAPSVQEFGGPCR